MRGVSGSLPDRSTILCIAPRAMCWVAARMSMRDEFVNVNSTQRRRNYAELLVCILLVTLARTWALCEGDRLALTTTERTLFWSRSKCPPSR